MTGRYQTETTKIKTEFGSIYLHIDRDNTNNVVSAWLSWGRKDPENKIAGLISTISNGLDEALKNG